MYAWIILYHVKYQIFPLVQTMCSIPVVSDEGNLGEMPETSVHACFERAQRRYKQQQEKERDLQRSSIIILMHFIMIIPMLARTLNSDLGRNLSN